MVLENYRGSQFLQTEALGHYEQDFTFEQEDGLMVVIGFNDLSLGKYGKQEEFISINYLINKQDGAFANVERKTM